MRSEFPIDDANGMDDAAVRIACRAAFPNREHAPRLCDDNDDGSRAIYTLRCARTGESDEVVVCMRHAEHMPLVDDDLVTARPGEAGASCDFSTTTLRRANGRA